ncbi:MAG TPA: hypothetical protein VFM69_12970 [Pricia sp.]|nr:hypothetical protein [Pricia sp.]
MKKAVSIFAVVVMSVGLFTACESETSIEESDALYELEVQAGDGEMQEITGRP